MKVQKVEQDYVFGLYERPASRSNLSRLIDVEDGHGQSVPNVMNLNIPVDEFDSYCPGEFVVAKKKKSGFCFQRALQMRKWEDFEEARNGAVAFEVYLKECQSSELSLMPRYKVPTRDLLINANERYYAGFEYDFDTGHVNCRVVRRAKDGCRMWDHCYFYFAGKEVLYKGESFILASLRKGTDSILNDEGVWDPMPVWTPKRDRQVLPHLNDEDKPIDFDADALNVQSSPSIRVMKPLGTSKAGEWDSEQVFLERFIEYTKRCGFKYSDRDLVRFHTSVKTGLSTILTGMPGCGKSSLVELYARALAGRNYCAGADCEQNGFIRIDVNPAWIEPADLLGYRNPMHSNGFVPAENGLWRYLRMAMKNEERMHLVCLEEMNLACVEHYFSDFIQLLSRSAEDRIIKGYNDGVDNNDLRIGENVRFIGTCNEDETTRRMSLRFLDRNNVIDLQFDDPEYGLSQHEPKCLPLEDTPVSKMVYDSWCDRKETALCEDVCKAFTLICEQFQAAGVNVSPRIGQSISSYVRSRPNFEKYESETVRQFTALDEAVAQRIVPLCSISQSKLNDFNEVVRALEGLKDKKWGGADFIIAEKLLCRKIDTYKTTLGLE